MQIHFKFCCQRSMLFVLGSYCRARRPARTPAQSAENASGRECSFAGHHFSLLMAYTTLYVAIFGCVSRHMAKVFIGHPSSNIAYEMEGDTQRVYPSLFLCMCINAHAICVIVAYLSRLHVSDEARSPICALSLDTQARLDALQCSVHPLFSLFLS